MPSLTWCAVRTKPACQFTPTGRSPAALSDARCGLVQTRCLTGQADQVHRQEGRSHDTSVREL
ncbi:MAG: hypothetical protein QOF52_3498 [Propionibacteriaceae bacterium]|jgi:hypothetical protein|nr:hypothetical protein [Propionibacteriaceae bacterium]MDX6323640.1 hypothetical protein [Propionibacteriaceae bacterium]